ncbi:MAG: DUF523 and DUF1722 domain-containing protein [Deltaproteobacteria bacterium]|nr:DUF523 and DUF1722 domain-containing protein [Deltaproteobacteria bacterium]
MVAPARSPEAIRIGISSCLLGAEVRHDGGHRRDRLITDVLGDYFEYTPVCPELESGMGVPREPVRLVGDVDRPLMVGVRSGEDHTRRMERYSQARVKALARLDLSGYLLKAKSPSCGMERVKTYNRSGSFVGKNARGIFARHLIEGLPHLPVEEEGRLKDAKLRENFVERVFCYHRWRALLAAGITAGRLVAFHTAHKLLLMAHSPDHYRRLGRLVASAKKQRPAALAESYAALFFEGLAHQATTKRNTNVLQHVAGYFRKQITRDERTELAALIEEYHRGLLPLIVPITLINHYVRKYDEPYLAGQLYLNPHPRELMLRNHV